VRGEHGDANRVAEINGLTDPTVEHQHGPSLLS
jgi:hypothetical protein